MLCTALSAPGRSVRGCAGRPGFLLITPVYPPVASPGTFRPLKLVKYLPEFGFTPQVLTQAVARGASLDRDLLSEVALIQCTRVQMPLDLSAVGRRWAQAPWISRAMVTRDNGRPRRHLMRLLLRMRDYVMLPDHLVTGVPKLCWAANDIVKSRGIRVICTTGPHHSIHLVGLWLKRRLRAPCWIADFRDAWVTDPKNTFPTRYHRWFNAQLEARVVQLADAVVTVSAAMRADFLARYPTLSAAKFHTIYNGYDESDFSGVRPVSHGDGRVHVVHTGTVYERSGMDQVIGCLGRVLQADPALARRVRFDFVGQVHPAAWQALRACLDEWVLHDVVQFHGSVSHREAISRMLGADLLLLVTGPGREVVTTKVFEYMRAGNPIVLIADAEAEVRRMLDSAAIRHWFAERSHPGQIGNCFRQVLQATAPDRGGLPDRVERHPASQAFSRREAAFQFAEVARCVLTRAE